MQLTVIAVVVSLLACVYLWQSSAHQRPPERILGQIEQKLTDLERQNVDLMLQVARLNAPRTSKRRPAGARHGAGSDPLVMQVPNPAQPTPNAAPAWADLASRWQQLDQPRARLGRRHPSRSLDTLGRRRTSCE